MPVHTGASLTFCVLSNKTLSIGINETKASVLKKAYNKLKTILRTTCFL